MQSKNNVSVSKSLGKFKKYILLVNIKLIRFADTQVDIARIKREYTKYDTIDVYETVPLTRLSQIGKQK